MKNPSYKIRQSIKSIITAFSAVFICSNAFSSDIKLKSEAAIMVFYGPQSELIFKKMPLPPAIKSEIQNKVKQSFFKEDVYSWKVKMGDTVAGYVLLDNVLGKAMPITFMVMFDTGGKILNTQIVKYRESIGGEVASRGWAQQFVGKTCDSGFVVGTDVDGISGATISVSAITRGIQKLACLLSKIKGNL